MGRGIARDSPLIFRVFVLLVVVDKICQSYNGCDDEEKPPEQSKIDE